MNKKVRGNPMSENPRMKNVFEKFFTENALGRRIYKYRFFELSFMIPLLVLTIAYIALGVWPFGERQVQIIDSYHQYAPFFAEFHRKVWSGESLF